MRVWDRHRRALRGWALAWAVLACALAYGQGTDVAALQQAVHEAPPDSSRVDLQLRLSLRLRGSQIDLARQQAQEALELAKTLHYARGKAKAYNALAVICRMEGEHDQALANFLHALTLNESLRDTTGICQTLNGIGATYLKIEAYPQARSHFEQVLRLREIQGDTAGIAVSLSNLGETWEKIGNYHKAISFHRKSVDLDLSIGHAESTDYALHSLGRIYLRMGYRDQSHACLHQALGIRHRTRFLHGVAETSLMLGNLHLQEAHYDSAVFYYSKALNNAQAVQANPFILEALHGLAKSHKAQHAYQKASDSYEQYVLLYDSVYSTERDRAFNQMMARYEHDRKEQELSLLKKDNELHTQRIERQQLNIAYLGLSVALLLALLSVGYALYASKRRRHQEQLVLNQQLQLKQEEIMAQSEELHLTHHSLQALNATLEQQVRERTQALNQSNKNLEMYLYRSAHDLRGPIASIRGLVQITQLTALSGEQQELVGKIRETAENMEAILVKINVLAMLNQGTVCLEPFRWGMLMRACAQRHEALMAQKGIAWEAQCAADPELQGDAFLLGALLDCLVENAVYFGARQGWVRVSAVPAGSGWALEVSDNGIGMDASLRAEAFRPYFRGQANSQGHGLGLYVAKNIVERLGGSIELRSRKKEGTTVSVWLPLAQG